VDLSIGNITIFQDDPERKIIRQIISGNNHEFVELEDENIVSVKIIKSTFNQPGGSYHVTIDNNFVKSQANQEPLYGIKNHGWSFTIESKCFIISSFFNEIELIVIYKCLHFLFILFYFILFFIFLMIFKIASKEKESSDSIRGIVRLTPEGTEHFEGLNDVDRETFYTKLRQELANAIPISSNRVITNGNIEVDISAPRRQIILSINIKKDETNREISVNSAIKDLNILIWNKPITVIASGEYTRHLDQGYGYKTSRKNSSIIFKLCQIKNLFLKKKIKHNDFN